MNARRAHSKSRNGCDLCKARKVKCDEAVPCLRCVKRGDKCSLVSSSSSSAESSFTPASSNEIGSESSAGPHAAPQDEVFTLIDIQLFQRFTSVTCQYLANPNRASPWLDKIPAMSTKHPFLLHEMMALAAVDLSRDTAQSQAASKSYLDLARRHHAKALAGLMPAVTSNSAALVAPVWACNSLFVPYYFATADDAAMLLFTPEPHAGPAEWMLPLRGAVTIWKSNESVLLGGAMGPHLKPYLQNLQESAAADEPHMNPSDPVVMRMIGQLQLVEGDDDLTGDERRVMAEAFELLRHFFRLSDRDDALAKKTASLTCCATFPSDFFVMLARKKTTALVVMAFWCVLLHRAEKGNWWMNIGSDRLKDMLGVIADMLGPEGRKMIVWPLEQIMGPLHDVEARSFGDIPVRSMMNS
ncbi:unnamed protein product [Discula destructiva]